MTIAFTVYGAAEAKGNLRAFTPRGMRFPVITDRNRNVKAWQHRIAEAAGYALGALPEEDRQLLTGGVRCEVTYYLPRPKALDAPRYRGVEVPHTKRPDIDKLTRAVFDALTRVLWADDSQVSELLAIKRYAALGAPARVDIAVMPTTPTPAALPFDSFDWRPDAEATTRDDHKEKAAAR